MMKNIVKRGEDMVKLAYKKRSLIKVIKLNSLKLKKCDLIKMDVEGHEWNIINGGQNFIIIQLFI